MIFKVLYILILSFAFSIHLGFAQEIISDSLEYYEPIDSTKKHTAGFSIGVGALHPLISPKLSNDFSSITTKAELSYNLGLSLIFPRNKGLIETGLFIQNTKISLDYYYKNSAYNEIMNISNLIFPLLYSTYDSINKKSLYLAAGLFTSIDITKKTDKELRTFPIKNILPGIMLKTGYRIKSITAIYDLSLVAYFYPFNILKNNQTVYNIALNKTTPISLGFQFTIR
jgi:hypothetical protein